MSKSKYVHLPAAAASANDASTQPPSAPSAGSPVHLSPHKHPSHSPDSAASPFRPPNASPSQTQRKGGAGAHDAAPRCPRRRSGGVNDHAAAQGGDSHGARVRARARVPRGPHDWSERAKSGTESPASRWAGKKGWIRPSGVRFAGKMGVGPIPRRHRRRRRSNCHLSLRRLRHRSDGPVDHCRAHRDHWREQRARRGACPRGGCCFADGDSTSKSVHQLFCCNSYDGSRGRAVAGPG